MGGTTSSAVHATATRKEDLLKYIRSLDVPEKALLSDEALLLVDCNFCLDGQASSAVEAQGDGEEEETEKKFTGLAVPPEAHTAGSWQRMLGHSASATS